MRPWTTDDEDAAAASGFNTDTAVEAFIFNYLGAIYAAVEDVAGNPGLDLDEGADLEKVIAAAGQQRASRL